MYSREIDGRTLTMTTSGFTYYAQHVLFDRETQSFWFHRSGTNDLTCIAGHYAGRVLPGLESGFNGPWHVWKDTYPLTQYLKPSRPPR